MNIIKVNPKNIRLDKKSIKLRQNIVQALEKYKRGHIGPAFSCLEIIRVIFDKYLNKKNKDNDFLLSKGHGCLALYSILYENKIINKKLWQINKGFVIVALYFAGLASQNLNVSKIKNWDIKNSLNIRKNINGVIRNIGRREK